MPTTRGRAPSGNLPKAHRSTAALPVLRFLGRMRIWAKANPILATLLIVAGAGAAAITISYTTDSTVTTQTVSPPIQFVAGDDAGPSTLTDYVTAYTISTNKTFFTSTVKGVPEATLTVDSYFKLDNTDDASRSVTLTTSQVTNAKVTAYTLQIYDSSDTLLDTLDFKAVSPSATFTVPADGGAEPVYAKLTLTLATGTTDTDLGGGLSNDLAMTIS